jgi:hypothetical protein
MTYDIGRISGGSHNFGPNGTVINNGVEAADLTAAVAGLLAALRAHAAELAEPARAQAAALAVQDEARAARPRRERLLALLRDTATGAGEVAAVVGAVQGVVELVHVLP